MLLVCGFKTNIHNIHQLISENIEQLIFEHQIFSFIHWLMALSGESFLWPKIIINRPFLVFCLLIFFCHINVLNKCRTDQGDNKKCVFNLFCASVSGSYTKYQRHEPEFFLYLYLFEESKKKRMRINSKSTIFVLNLLFDFKVKK